LKKFDNFPVVVSWIQDEDIEIQFAKSDHDNDEVMAEVMRIIQNEMKEIEDADI
jgi:SH3-like domain-containing protein